jgi:hypothetical protein
VDSPLLSFFQHEEREVPFGGRLAITDPRLGVEGLPQSATGQTTILTGENASKLIGRHLNGYPSPRLRDLLAERSIYRQLTGRGATVTFANAYTPTYFESRPRFVSATTVAAETAGVRLRTLEDLAAGNAVFHDFTNKSLVDRGLPGAVLSPEQAGANLARLAAKHGFTLYEHFITDRLGHDRDYEKAVNHLERLDRFIRSVLSAIDLERVNVIVTSDHGNIEDLRTRSHTMNMVATLSFGPGRDVVRDRVRCLTDITPIATELVAHP